MRLSDALKQLGRPVVFYPRLAEIFGIPESIFISHFVYWSDKGSAGDGWIYKSREEIAAETGLTYEQQKRVRKVLTAKSGGLKGHHRTIRSVTEAVLEERHERAEHRIYFRIDFEALDRAFSQGQLFPMFDEGQLGIPPVAARQSHSASEGLPQSSITESTTESTQISARKTAHKDFVKWWDGMATRIRRVKVEWSHADFRNLKIMLATGDQQRLEQLALYFLADGRFKKYAPTLRVFLSKGVMEGLKNAQNVAGFWAQMDTYSATYLTRLSLYTQKIPSEQEKMKQLTTNLAAKFAVKKHE